MKLNLRIITPSGEFYKDEIDSLNVNTCDGYLTILPNHFPLVTSVVPSCLNITIDGKLKKASIASGLLNVKHDEVLLIVDAIEFKDQIDLERAYKALERAKIRLVNKPKDIDVLRAEAALKRAIARISVAEDK